MGSFPGGSARLVRRDSGAPTSWWHGSHPKPTPPRTVAVSALFTATSLRRLPAGNGKKNAKFFPLVALVYVREQLRRTIIHIEDESVAALFGLSARQVRRVRETMLDLGFGSSLKPEGAKLRY